MIKIIHESSMENKKYVEYLLKNYHSLKRDLNVLKIQLEQYEREDLDETILGMALKTKDFKEGKTGNSRSDSTGNIAITYESVNKKEFLETKNRIKRIILAGDTEILKLETALNSIDKLACKVLMDIYIHKLTWEVVCKREYISNNTLSRYKKIGLDNLAAAFAIEG